MDIAGRLQQIRKQLPDQTRLVAVSKFHPAPVIMEAYNAGQRIFGESRVQEITAKYDILPKDIVWHFIGHLQSNKVKHIIPLVCMIESVDSMKLLSEINQHAAGFGKVMNVLLQIHIASEETKFGFSFQECKEMLLSEEIKNLTNVKICGLMGMATYTSDKNQVRSEFAKLASFFRTLKNDFFVNEPSFNELSMGMSNDFPLAIEEGSTLIRVGSLIFGERA